MTKLLAIFAIGLALGLLIIFGVSIYFLIKVMIKMLSEENYIGFIITLGMTIVLVSGIGFTLIAL